MKSCVLHLDLPLRVHLVFSAHRFFFPWPRLQCSAWCRICRDCAPGIQGGYRSALAVQLGSLIGDATWAVLGLVGVGFLLQLEQLRWPIGIAGILYLLWLAVDAWRASRQEFTAANDKPAPNTRHALKAGAMLSLANPQNIAYWAALGSAMGAIGVSEPGTKDYAVFFSGFMLASLFWSFLCAAVVARLFKNTRSGWVKLTYRLCALAFLALAFTSLRELTKESDSQVASPARTQEMRR